ncbi:hypothetical protein D3C79_1110600 [compost metagenome]
MKICDSAALALLTFRRAASVNVTVLSARPSAPVALALTVRVPVPFLPVIVVSP